MTTGLAFPSPEKFMEQVSEQRGLDDFGEGNFLEGLQHFLGGVQRANLGDAQIDRVTALVRRRLTSRLEVEDHYRMHPKTNDVILAAPISITGLPRTGTTALVNLLSLDEQFRPLRNWEQQQPCPPPIIGHESDDPRRLKALAEAEEFRHAQPEFAAMHLTDVDATEEDVELLGLSFHAQQSVLPIFDYHAWWRDADLRDAFAYHRRVAKLLLSHRPPNRWLFKAPSHNFHLDALFSAYPDARVIVTHRDPAKVIPSVISLLTAMQNGTPSIGLEDFGRLHAEHFRKGVERSLEARARIGEDRFYDVHHSDFLADPMRTIEGIYQFLNLELHSKTKAKMLEWHEQNRSGAHGTHSYTPEQFGLTVDKIRDDFDFYIKHFDLA